MNVRHYPVEKLKADLLHIAGRRLDLTRYKLFFFGSRVTNKGDDHSDIDVGITGPEAQLAQFTKALTRLNEALAAPKSDIVRDSAIQRFEFTMDMAWKLVKTCLEEKYGVLCQSPKECFRSAYNQKLLAYDEFWLELVDMRNQTSHTYKEELAQSVYERLPKAAEYMDKLLKLIEQAKK